MGPVSRADGHGKEASRGDRTEYLWYDRRCDSNGWASSFPDVCYNPRDFLVRVPCSRLRMDAFRYYLALFAVIVFPVAFSVWFSIHPFIRFWRKLGPMLTYSIHFIAMGLVATGLFLLRGRLLSIQFGTNPVLVALAIPIFVFAFVVAVRMRMQIGWKVLVGLPEIAPDKHKTQLITTGVYSRIRHPRYAEALVGTLAHALFTNYLAVYAVFLLFLVGFPLIVRLEERELRVRFGGEYERYSERVPRFVPKF